MVGRSCPFQRKEFITFVFFVFRDVSAAPSSVGKETACGGISYPSGEERWADLPQKHVEQGTPTETQKAGSTNELWHKCGV